MRRPAMTDPGELLLFVTEPQQLDAVFEYGTETLSPASIRVGDDDESARRDCCAAHPWDDCEPDCDCPSCEVERALDDDADAYADREV